ncbi:hypothetical protein IJT10_07325 [bacterium]|nr:hypothetical protein [bacterium]
MNSEHKAKSLASKYIKQKYGFRAKVLHVELDKPSWLEFGWKRPSGAYVIMEHDGVKFRTRVSFDGKREPADSYETNKIENEAKKYFEHKLEAQKLALRLDFTEDNRLTNLATKNTRSFQDVIKNDKCSVVINIYVYGLREESIDNINMKELGNNTIIGISDWKVDDFPTEHANIYRSPQVACEDDLVYLNAHYFIDRQGKVKAQYYNVEELTEDISILTSDDIDIRIEKVYPEPNLDNMELEKIGTEKNISKRPITPWYRVRLLSGNYKSGDNKAILFLKLRPQDGNLSPLEGDRKGIDTRYAMECIKPNPQLKTSFVWYSNIMMQPSNDLSNYRNRKFLCSKNLIVNDDNMFRIVIRE